MAQERGRNLLPPLREIIMGGEKYRLVFDNRALVAAEAVYEDEYGKNFGIYQIMQECAVPKQRAIMAVIYAAMRSGGANMTWENFLGEFRLSDLPGIQDAVTSAILETLPDGEDDGKNAEATAGTEK